MILGSNLYLQYCQNDLSASLMINFAFYWHTEKFLLGCLVLAVFLLFLISLTGQWGVGSFIYLVVILLLGYADYQKMTYRMEPIYPDDLKMITEFSLLKEMIGTVPFVLAVFFLILALAGLLFSIYRSFFLPKKAQVIRMSALLLTIGLLFYIGQFNNENNLLRKAYNRTALWIPYSQKMNYYNTGFIGGFLYNLKVEAMSEPANYSKKTIQKIVAKYAAQAATENQTIANEETPNIIFVMSESFSDPLNVEGVGLSSDPLTAYREIADQTYSGLMLSQNYGGGTANIEFEALTGFSMEPFNAQMTTPYTMLLPKLAQLPSIVSLLNAQGYQATAIHPYNTSMYKRQDAYDKLGFSTFLSQDTMEHKSYIEDNPYISDDAAYSEIIDLLKDGGETPQFIHLVTMQTHMPYDEKYEDSDYTATGVTDNLSINNYAQDIAYSSEALADFLDEVDQLPQHTLVIFWGDHLPSIYSESIQAENDELTMHETNFLFYDNQQELSSDGNQSRVTSPVYFAPTLFQTSGLKTTGFYQLLLQLQEKLPAFEKNFYLSNEGEWTQKLKLSESDQQIYDDYQLIQYDIVSGEQYSLNTDFYEESD